MEFEQNISADSNHSKPPDESSSSEEQHTVLPIYRRLWLKPVARYMFLVFIMLIYICLGGVTFFLIEEPAEKKRLKMEKADLVKKAHHYTKTIIDMLITSCLHTGNGTILNSTDCNHRLSLEIESYMRAEKTPLKRPYAWSFSTALFYCYTIVTTIGYGNVTCKTLIGQMLTIVYGLLGIPLSFSVLSGVGKLLVASMVRTRKALCRLRRNIGRKFSKGAPEQPDATPMRVQFPMILSLLIMTVYLATFSGLFMLWEDWDYPTALYYTFVSLSTIGFGDVVPAEPIMLRGLAGGLIIVVGLAVVSLCLNLMQQSFEGDRGDCFNCTNLHKKAHVSKGAEPETSSDPLANGRVHGYSPVIDSSSALELAGSSQQLNGYCHSTKSKSQHKHLSLTEIGVAVTDEEITKC